MPLFRAQLTEKALLFAGLSTVGAGCEGTRRPYEIEESETTHRAAFAAEADGGDGCEGAVTSLLDGGAVGDGDGGSCRSVGKLDPVDAASDAGVPFEPEGVDGRPARFSSAGPGCLDAGARLTWAADKRSMHIEFDRLRIELTAAGPRNAMTFCDLVLPVASGRQTFAIKAITTTMLADLPDGVTAGLSFVPRSLGSPLKPEQGDTRRLAAPMRGRAAVRSDFSDKLAFLPCDSARQLILLARTNVQSQPDREPSPASLAIASVDVELAMRECPTDGSAR